MSVASGEHGAVWLQLICPQLRIDDLRSARQVSKACRDAASSTVAALTIEEGASHLPKATSTFQEVQKVHLVIRRAKLRESNRDVAGVDQDEGVMPDTGQSATESTMWTAQLAALQGYRPRSLLCVEVADDLKLSTHEQRDGLLRQLCHPF